MKIRPNAAARTHQNDIKPIIEISGKVGRPIEGATFLGSSPIRRLVEDWTVDHLQRTTADAVKFAVDAGLPVMYVTEDTMRTDPATIATLSSSAIRAGARAAVLCDTVGHATPAGAFNLVKFVIDEVIKPSGEKFASTGMATTIAPGHRSILWLPASPLAPIKSTPRALALGERRVGNTPMELMPINLNFFGLIDHDLSQLKSIRKPSSGPRTLRSRRIIQSSVATPSAPPRASTPPPSLKPTKKAIASWPTPYTAASRRISSASNKLSKFGPLSGRSNVIYWLEKRKIPATDRLVDRLFAAATQTDRVMTDPEILELVRASN